MPIQRIPSEEEWKPWLHTITSDNGKEFAKHSQIAEALNIDFYFAKPYRSWQRGANENLNGLIRQYFPMPKASLSQRDPFGVGKELTCPRPPYKKSKKLKPY